LAISWCAMALLAGMRHSALVHISRGFSAICRTPACVVYRVRVSISRVRVRWRVR
jgi:hypothetical protein